MRLLPWKIAALALAAGCGAKVTVDSQGTAGTTGSGASGVASATATTTGSGGVSGSSVATSTAVSTGTGPSNLCGGKAGLQCPPNDFCKWDQPNSCGNADGTGVCEPRPADCPINCPGVCGCDGQKYCNACTASDAGVDVDGNASCGEVDAGPPPPLPDHYVAWELPTNVPRFAIAKIEPSADLCVVMVLAEEPGASAGLVIPSGWSVTESWIQQGAAACESMVGSFPVPSGQAVMSIGGGGTITYDNNNFPCFVTLNAAQLFPQAAPWVPMDLLATTNLPVQGTCGG